MHVHVFSDVFEHVIASVAYLRVINETGATHLAFLMVKSKLAPLKGHTVPELELFRAVFATDVGKSISNHLNILQDRICDYINKRIVLGYSNSSRRFFMCVTNRVEKFTRFPSQLSGLVH